MLDGTHRCPSASTRYGAGSPARTSWSSASIFARESPTAFSASSNRAWSADAVSSKVEEERVYGSEPRTMTSSCRAGIACAAGWT